METKQRIYLDGNNKLVVETNNATIDGYNKTITNLNGEFTIDANNVAKLLSMINEKNMFAFYPMYGENTKWYIGDANDLTHQLDCEIELRKNREEKCRGLDQRIWKLKRKIEDFNETRHCWERKIKIDE
jgi:hypothetical protein